MFLVVNVLFKDEAGEIIKSFNMNIVTSQKFLGVVIGDSKGKDLLIK